jgi:hypothetical protein
MRRGRRTPRRAADGVAHLRWRVECTTDGKGESMRKLFVIVPALAIALAAGKAAADTASCTIKRIKDKDVSIEVPIKASIGPEIFCKTRAQSAAKQYAIDNAVCARDNARESTFSVTVVYKVDKTERTHEVKAYCPILAKRK